MNERLSRPCLALVLATYRLALSFGLAFSFYRWHRPRYRPAYGTFRLSRPFRSE